MSIILLSMLTNEQNAIVETIFKEHYTEFLEIARKILRSQSDAEDVLAYAFQKIIENIGKISDLSCPKQIAYCIVIVKNRAYQVYNARKRLSLDYEIQESLPDDLDLEEDYIRKVDMEQLGKAMNKLSEEDRHLVVLRYLYHQRYAQIAELLGMSADAARKRTKRILKKLLEILESG